MNVQEACEAANITSYQMRNSFEDHKPLPGKLDIQERVPAGSGTRSRRWAIKMTALRRTSGPDQRHLLRQGARDVLGRQQQLRGGLRDRLVNGAGRVDVRRGMRGGSDPGACSSTPVWRQDARCSEASRPRRSSSSSSSPATAILGGLAGEPSA